MQDRARLQRRTLIVLAIAQVFGGAGFFLGIAVAALLARDVSGSDSLSGLPIAIGVATAATASAPLAGWMARVGRRPGLAAGHLASAAGSCVVLLAAGIDSFPLLCAGTAAFSLGNTSNLLARYAATDLAPAAARGRAISLVLLATAAGAIAGPNVASATGPIADWLGVPEHAGPFALAVVGSTLAALILVGFLRPDPLLAARSGGPAAAQPHWFEALRSLRSWPSLALTGVAAMAVGQVAMVAVMTMTPVHMTDSGESLSAVGLVISLHVAGMFLPSPVSGWLADRVGRLPVLAAGGVALIAAGAIAAFVPGHDAPLMAVALVLLGIGWNLGLVGGSALVTDAVAVERRPQTQGAADLLMGLTGAGASLVAGPLFHAGAFGLLGAGAALLGVLMMALASRAREAAPATA